MANDAASLPEHLLTRGLLGGRHSDITVIVFGQRYALHRIILDRAPFFATALSEPWLEASAKQITLHPEDIDPNITQTAFELALKRLYGCDIQEDEVQEATGLFATGCWLEMQDLVDSAVDAILRQMSPDSLAPLVRLVTINYYGRAGEKILASAKSMLCRDGWEMPIRYWDGIPGDIVREIVGGDGFFVDGEWSRWTLAKRLLDRRLKQRAVEAGLAEPGQKLKVKVPDTLGLMAVRFDAVYRQNAITTGLDASQSHAKWLSLYTNPDIEPLLVLLDEGIHYVHLDFEQLQFIRQARDVFGLPVMPEKVITNALWMQMELRQRVLNSDETDMELGLSKPLQEPLTVKTSNESKGKEKMGEEVGRNKDAESEVHSWEGNGRPRKFWIPSVDCNIVMGGNAEPLVTASNQLQRLATTLSGSLQPEDVQWATDFVSSTSNTANPDSRVRSNLPARPGSASGSNAGQPQPIAYTHYPPFRFAAEFPNPRHLKEKKRVYSRTVFYAGSLWNIYIQKVRSSKNAQLGVYLHRAKERETEEVIAGTAGLSQGSVDERIGLLEREMILRSERRRNFNHRNQSQAAAEDDTSGSGGEADNAPPAGSPPTSRNTLFSSLPRRTRPRKLGVGSRSSRPSIASPTTQSSEAVPQVNEQSITPTSDVEDEADNNEDDTEPELANPSTLASSRKSTKGNAATIPPYVDSRPTIKTYFKIYSPSKGGRLLSVYESAPDRFNFSQSWGWKSSTLMLDEGLLDGGSAPGADKDEDEASPSISMRSKTTTEGKLRFMVVIGNL
jgi:hypothetical protein